MGPMLEQQLATIYDREKHGLIYHAMKLLAEQTNIVVDEKVLWDMGIRNDLAWHKDEQVAVALGFPPQFFSYEKKEGILPFTTKTIYYPHPRICMRALAVAAYLLLSRQEISQPSVTMAAPNRQPTVPSSPKPVPFALAIVLKGYELDNLQLQSITREQATELLEMASYSMCAPHAKVQDIIDTELTFDTAPIDYESQQQILVVIDFQHTPPLPPDENLTIKFGLKQLLKEDSTDFQVTTIKPLAKISGLVALGFIRTG